MADCQIGHQEQNWVKQDENQNTKPFQKYFAKIVTIFSGLKFVNPSSLGHI